MPSPGAIETTIEQLELNTKQDKVVYRINDLMPEEELTATCLGVLDKLAGTYMNVQRG